MSEWGEYICSLDGSGKDMCVMFEAVSYRRNRIHFVSPLMYN